MFVMHLFSTLDMLKFLKNIKLFRTLLTYIMKLFLKFFSHVFPDARMHGCFCPCITLCVRFNDCCSDLRKTFCYMFSPCGKFSVLWIKNNTYFNYFYSMYILNIFFNFAVSSTYSNYWMVEAFVLLHCSCGCHFNCIEYTDVH